MRVSLIKNNSIEDLLLPKRVNGSFWITDLDSNGHEVNLISVEARDNGWYLISNEEYGILVNNVFLHEVALKEYQFYVVKSKKEEQLLILYCSYFHDNSYCKYSVDTTKEISIGNGQGNTICYQSSNIDEVHAKITFDTSNNCFILSDNNSKNGVYVNNTRIVGNYFLKNGDVIFIMGLKLILSKCGDEYHILFNNPNNLVISNVFIMPLTSSSDTVIEEDEEVEFSLYKEEDYFHKKPRFTQKIEQLKLVIDAPPGKGEEQETPILLTVGPMVTMSMTSLLSGYTAVNNVLTNGASWSSAAPSLVICGAMVSSVLIWPSLTKKYEKRQRKKKEKERQKKYSQYIEQRKKMITDELVKQSKVLISKYPLTSECQNIVLQKLTRLWERRSGDDDFLTVSLGLGSVPLDIHIQYPEDHFSMVEDNLKDMVNDLGNAPKNMSSVPIAVSFATTRLLAIIGDNNLTFDLIRQILLQLVTFQSYDDLKLVVLTTPLNESEFDFVKILPHNWSDDKSFRFFGTNAEEYKEICYNLERIFHARKESGANKNLEDVTRYIIVTDSLSIIRNFEFIKNILEEKEDFGFSFIMLDHRITNIPDECESFIQLTTDRNEYYKTLVNNQPILFDVDRVSKIDYEKCARVLANIPIKLANQSEGQLPTKLGFLEMYDVGKIEQLNILNRWEKNNPMLSLSAPIGFGKGGELIGIDLHEKYHGPHGLIAGMTGSGKSEFIISYILSMAINYHPYEVQFILIDYKGGGLAGAFENSTTGVKLPHLVGTITNLDANEITRSLASIESELKRRQRLFNQAREKSGESTIDIYKYQKMYREKVVDEPVSHLFIISDEFAELKNQQPEFMDQLISTARIGRSLGVHLILATQKPSGVVDPQIWSNTRFRVCLRVQEKGDSNEVIKCPDAAYLKQTGRFYFQVGYNEIFVLGQAAWAGGKYIPSERLAKNVDSSIEFIDNIGYVIKSVDTKKKKEVVASNGEELINIVKSISEIAKKEAISCRPLWLPKIPEFITINQLIEEYSYQKGAVDLNPIIGKYDDPSRQEQHLLTIPITKEGNALIYGVSGSGKENMISTMIYSTMLYYHPNEVQYYIVDFGSEALRVFQNSPLVGDILYSLDAEKIANLYKMLSSTIEERKKLFADYNGEYVHYCKNSGNIVPSIVVVINNFESYQETFPDFEEELTVLSRDGVRYGIYFIITSVTPNGVRFKLKQNFNQEFVLQQNSDDDYTTILGNVRRKYPARILGRGIIKTDDVYEFQTAYITNPENIHNAVKELNEKLKNSYEERAKAIPILPEVVDYSVVMNSFGKEKEAIIGISKEDLSVTTFDFHKNPVSVITSNDILLNYKFILPFINQMIALNRENVIVINAEDFTLDEKYKKYIQYYSNNFDEVFEKLEIFANEKFELYKNNEYNKSIFDGVRPILCIIIGIDRFKSRLSDVNKGKFASIFEKIKDLDILHYILVDSVDKIKKVEIDAWYKNCVSTTDGIWIGNGINEQFSLKCNQKTQDMKLEVSDDFCFVIQRGKAKLVKYITDFAIRFEE